MKKSNIFLMIAVLLLTFGCNKSEIQRYELEDSALNFPGNQIYSQDTIFQNTNYDSKTKLFTVMFSFLKTIGSTSARVSVPVKVVGPSVPYDRPIEFEIVKDTIYAQEGDYTFVRAVVPAGKMYGEIVFDLKYDVDLKVNDKILAINLKASKDFKEGYIEFRCAHLIWNEKLTPPTSSNEKRTYNHLIKGEPAPTSTALNYYSPNAHKLILLILEADDIPAYTVQPWVVYSNYLSYCAKMDKFLKQWNIDHPNDPWLHDAGKDIGKKITPRGYNYDN